MVRGEATLLPSWYNKSLGQQLYIVLLLAECYILLLHAIAGNTQLSITHFLLTARYGACRCWAAVQQMS